MPKLSKKAIFIKEYEAVVASQVRKAYICFCLDDEDRFEDEMMIASGQASRNDGTSVAGSERLTVLLIA